MLLNFIKRIHATKNAKNGCCPKLAMLLDFDEEEDTPTEECKPALKKCGGLCIFLSIGACFVIIILLIALIVTSLPQAIHVVYIQNADSVVETSDKFLSIALDSSMIAHGFNHFDFTDPRVLNAMKALSPAYLRIGGTMADRLIFTKSNYTRSKHYLRGELDGGPCSYGQFCEYFVKPNFSMNVPEWLKLNRLAKETNLTLIFDLNVLLRLNNGAWDFRNAKKLISFSAKHDFDLNWELGNEPNSFKHQFHREIDPVQLAKDFHVLKNILRKYPKYANSLLVGPDVTRPQLDRNESMTYLKTFLETGASAIDAITWHQYYFDGATATIGDFLNPANFDILKWQIETVKQIAENADKPIWLGETSSAYGGGAPHLSNRFIASFLWLDKLGMAAKLGLDVVIRQSIFHGYYALLNHKYYPSPDWWVSILHKKLVGNRIVNCHMADSSAVRLYCQCTKQDYSNTPSVTVFGINLKSRRAKIRFEGVVSLNSNQNVDAYVLTTVERIESRYIYLNKNLLKLTESGDLPDLAPKIIKSNPYVVMPAYSLAFWVIPAENLYPC